MGAADDRNQKAQGREPVSVAAGEALMRRGTRSRVEPGPARANCLPVREGYDRWSSTYDSDPNPLLALEERTLKPLIDSVQGRRALDLACGTGRWMSWLLSQGASVLGLDFSPAMLAVADAKPQLRGRLVQGHCCRLPFRPAVFDLVMCSFAIGHITTMDRLAREVARVTACGADVYVTDLHPRAYAGGWRTGFQDPQQSFEILTWPHPLQELLEIWSFAGFECVRIIECRLTEAERPIFVRAGRAPAFDNAHRFPAVLLCHFRQPN